MSTEVNACLCDFSFICFYFVFFSCTNITNPPFKNSDVSFYSEGVSHHSDVFIIFFNQLSLIVRRSVCWFGSRRECGQSYTVADTWAADSAPWCTWTQQVEILLLLRSGTVRHPTALLQSLNSEELNCEVAVFTAAPEGTTRR